jgi:hypothetical protein
MMIAPSKEAHAEERGNSQSNDPLLSRPLVVASGVATLLAFAILLTTDLIILTLSPPISARSFIQDNGCGFEGRLLIIGKSINWRGQVEQSNAPCAADILTHLIAPELLRRCPGQVDLMSCWAINPNTPPPKRKIDYVIFISYATNWCEMIRPKGLPAWWWRIPHRMIWFDDIRPERYEQGQKLMTDFTALLHPLRDIAQQLNQPYVPWPTDPRLLYPAKARHPVVLLDWNPICCSVDPQPTLDALQAVRRHRADLEVQALGLCNAAVDACLKSLPPSEFQRTLNRAWLFVSMINGTYERGVIEAQTAGMAVVSVGDVTNPELFDPLVTGVRVPNHAFAVQTALEHFIEGHHPEAIREFALGRYSYSSVVSDLMGVIVSLSQQDRPDGAAAAAATTNKGGPIESVFHGPPQGVGWSVYSKEL